MCFTWLLAVTPICQAQQPEQPMLLTSEASVALFEEGRRQALDLQLEAASQTFQKLAIRPDGQPAALYHFSVISFLKGIITDEPVYYHEFWERSDAFEEAIADAPASKWRTYLLAHNSLHRAGVHAKQDHMVKAALAARTAFKGFEELHKRHPTFYEGYDGLGMFHVVIGSLPSGYRWILRILGYEGDVQQGLAELRVAAERSTYAREEATVFLAMADIMINSAPEDGLRRLAELQRQHPKSPFFAHLYGYGLLSNREAVAAERQLRAALEAGRSAEHFYIDYSAYYLAQSLFRQGRFSEAEGYYRHYLQRHRGPALRALALLHLGQSLEMQDRREEAVAVYRQIASQREYDSDMAALRAAGKLLAAPMTAAERDLLRGRNAFDAGQYEKAIAVLMPVFETGAPNERTEAAYRLGRVYHAQGRLAEAIPVYEYAIAHGGVEGDRWAPWSQYYLGEIHAQQGEWQQARLAYHAALAYNGNYDYRQSLEQHAKAGLSRLNVESP